MSNDWEPIFVPTFLVYPYIGRVDWMKILMVELIILKSLPNYVYVKYG